MLIILAESRWKRRNAALHPGNAGEDLASVEIRHQAIATGAGFGYESVGRIDHIGVLGLRGRYSPRDCAEGADCTVWVE